MDKRLLWILLLFLFVGCDAATTSVSTIQTESESVCKHTPLAASCFQPSTQLDHTPTILEEFEIDETFDAERLNQQPKNWLLYSNAEYLAGGVSAKVEEGTNGRHVRMYSDGLARPPHPQSAPVPTFIFSTKFNLDESRAGIATASVMVPGSERNAVTVGVSTGAVNTISVTIDNNLQIVVKVGGPFYYHSLSGDGGTYVPTGQSVVAGEWNTFRFEWDADQDEVKAYWVKSTGDVLLFMGSFHVSNRFNAEAAGVILVPNNVKVTMPRGQAGYSYLDNVFVERKAG